LDAILVVDQRAFVRVLNERGSSVSPKFSIEKIECYFLEMRDFGYITPSFRIVWTVRDGSGAPRALEASSFGIRYDGRVWNNDDVKPQWIRGAAAAYQAATYKLAIALQRLIESEHPR
jgi:hypothetical protein